MSILAYYPILLSELNILRVSCLLRHGQLVAASVPLMLGVFAILGSPKQTRRAQHDRRSTTALRSDFERSTGWVEMLDFEFFLGRQKTPKSLETIAIFWERDPVPKKRANRIGKPAVFFRQAEDMVSMKKELTSHPNHPPCLHCTVIITCSIITM